MKEESLGDFLNRKIPYYSKTVCFPPDLMKELTVEWRKEQGLDDDYQMITITDEMSQETKEQINKENNLAGHLNYQRRNENDNL